MHIFNGMVKTYEKLNSNKLSPQFNQGAFSDRPLWGRHKRLVGWNSRPAGRLKNKFWRCNDGNLGKNLIVL